VLAQYAHFIALNIFDFAENGGDFCVLLNNSATQNEEKAIRSHSLWTSLGKPRFGTAFDNMKRDKAGINWQ